MQPVIPTDGSEPPLPSPAPGADHKTLSAAAEVLAGESRAPWYRRLLPFLSPAFIACIAYVDPGNFATNIQGGAQFGYMLLWVIVASNLMAMLTQALSASGAAQAVQAAREFLENCGAAKKLEAYCEEIDAPQTRGEHAYFVQIYERALEVLSGIARVFGDTPMTAQTLCSLVKTGFGAAKIAVIPPSTDAVALFDISTARLPDIDVLFAIGVQDGVWPARDDGPGILSAAERASLVEAGLDVGVYDLSAEKLKVYSALVKPKQKLYISYNTQSAPAVIVDRVKRLFPDIPVQKNALPAASLAGMRAALLGELASALRGKPHEGWLSGLLAQQMKRPGWEEEARRMLLRDNAAQPLGAGLAAGLYGAGSVSATRVESFCRCPFRHFLDFGLRAQAERDYTHDALDIGTYMHLALDLFARGITEDGVDLSTLTEDETERRMGEAADQAAQQHDYAKLTLDERFARQYALLKNELVSAAQRIRKHFAGSRASIYATEQPFSGYTVQTAQGQVAISGKIDRIDAAEGYFRVVDYKSSDTKFVLADVAAGVSLQLPVYIEAARRILRDTGLMPAGGYYMKIGDEYEDSPEAVDKEARMKGISLADAEVLRTFSAVLPDGDFSAVDQTLTKSGELHSRRGTKVAAQELEALLDTVNARIQSAADAIWAGETAISPVAGTSKGDVCEYCDYASICRMNADYAGNVPRVPEPFDRETLCGEAEDGQAVE
jgi:ATP-dependent helicase/DNAse subunit B